MVLISITNIVYTTVHLRITTIEWDTAIILYCISVRRGEGRVYLCQKTYRIQTRHTQNVSKKTRTTKGVKARKQASKHAAGYHISHAVADALAPLVQLVLSRDHDPPPRVRLPHVHQLFEGRGQPEDVTPTPFASNNDATSEPIKSPFVSISYSYIPHEKNNT